MPFCLRVHSRAALRSSWLRILMHHASLEGIAPTSGSNTLWVLHHLWVLLEGLLQTPNVPFPLFNLTPALLFFSQCSRVCLDPGPARALLESSLHGAFAGFPLSDFWLSLWGFRRAASQGMAKQFLLFGNNVSQAACL